MYTIGTAAKATGKAKSTISRDVKEGRISAHKNEDGSYAIDPAELHRVYPPLPSDNGSSNGQENDSQPPVFSVGTGGLQAELQRLRERLTSAGRALEQTEAERDRERRQLQDEIAYLRKSLEIEGEERRKLTAVLTDQRKAAVKSALAGDGGQAVAMPPPMKESMQVAVIPPSTKEGTQTAQISSFVSFWRRLVGNIPRKA